MPSVHPLTALGPRPRYVLLTELCEWLELGEKRANTPTGILLGVGEDVNDGQRTYGSPQ